MKKKIVVKVQMTCEKCRIKAKKIAASIEGVISIAVDGKDQEQLVVTGEGVDPVKLASKLRAKSVALAHLNAKEATVGGTGSIFAILGAWFIYQIQNKDTIPKEVMENMFQKAVIVSVLSLVLSNFEHIDDWTHLGAACAGLVYGLLICPTLELGKASSKNGETFTKVEATEVFFAVTKLFQSKDSGLRRMVYLMIKELSPSADEGEDCNECSKMEEQNEDAFSA
ncbi:hypothetical protein ACLOJK_041608 [Asimina triloba]